MQTYEDWKKFQNKKQKTLDKNYDKQARETLKEIKKRYVNIIENKEITILPLSLLNELKKRANRVLISSELLLEQSTHIHIISNGVPVVYGQKDFITIQNLSNPKMDTKVDVYENYKTTVVIEKHKNDFDIIEYTTDIKNDILRIQKKEYREFNDINKEFNDINKALNEI